MAMTSEQRAAKAIAKEAMRLSGLSDKDFAALSDEDKQNFIAQAKGEPGIDAKIEQEPDEDEVFSDDSDLVAMIKDGTVMKVHPTCVKAHEDAGWKVK